MGQPTQSNFALVPLNSIKIFLGEDPQQDGHIFIYLYRAYFGEESLVDASLMQYLTSENS